MWRRSRYGRIHGTARVCPYARTGRAKPARPRELLLLLVGQLVKLRAGCQIGPERRLPSAAQDAAPISSSLCRLVPRIARILDTPPSTTTWSLHSNREADRLVSTHFQERPIGVYLPKAGRPACGVLYKRRATSVNGIGNFPNHTARVYGRGCHDGGVLSTGARGQ